MGQSNRPTISNVAERAGVSTITVSRVINGSRHVSQETRAAVEGAIAELRYIPRAGARSLRSGRSHVVSLFVPDITNPFYSSITAGTQDHMCKARMSVLLSVIRDSLEQEQQCFEVAWAQYVDGMIITPAADESPIIGEAVHRGIPCVALDRSGFPVDTVIGDSVGGAHELTRLLLELGHRRIALINGPRSISTSRDRLRGYELALAEAGLEVAEQLVRWGPYTSDWGAEAAETLLRGPGAPTAIFAANNSLALGAMSTLQAHRIAVPEDMALVCFDEVPTPMNFVTLAAQPAFEMGRLAAEMLLERIGGHDAPPRQVVLPCEIRVRKSSGGRIR